jgi:hypothetical protein
VKGFVHGLFGKLMKVNPDTSLSWFLEPIYYCYGKNNLVTLKVRVNLLWGLKTPFHGYTLYRHCSYRGAYASTELASENKLKSTPWWGL